MYEIGRHDWPTPGYFGCWYTCPTRKVTVYLEFWDSFEDQCDITRALKIACQLNALGLIITRKPPRSLNPQNGGNISRHLDYKECPFKPFQPQFNSTFHAVDHDDLIIERHITDSVAIVSFENERFIYKFMTDSCFQRSFETEERNYLALAGVSGISGLRAVVRKAGVVQGLLTSYIEGKDLWSVAQNSDNIEESELFDITNRIVQLASVLEEQNFYHEDLKCSNVIRRDSDGELFFVDLGGGKTRGMYRPDRETHIILYGCDAVDALFTLGRTLWSLWMGTHPSSSVKVDGIRNKMVRDIITDCEEGNVETIIALRRKYFSAPL